MLNRDKIIKLAREAGISDGAFDFQMVSMDDLKHFAALVEAAECEACLEIADQCADADMHASMAANAIRARSQE